MSDLISRQDAINAIVDLPNCYNGFSDTYDKAYIIGTLEEVPSAVDCKKCIFKPFKNVPSAEPTLREKALSLLLDWAVECGFGYDNIPEEYELYKKDIENMDYCEGLIYIAEKELERDERHNI